MDVQVVLITRELVMFVYIFAVKSTRERLYEVVSYTLNPEILNLQTWNPKPKTWNLRPQT